ncbi:GNAT family N-acetyltransferase [Nocardioides sp. Soil805]|uniref:GNAT family N-acetyltransferase n=1 Tax=Nocardioides sp. Soil805 TaxID=1736416 RepID=UPI000703A84E|nr:GNAT family N-acetyltransferase [Nocardioides sp. Soil805]KRF37034.1 GCN5 family acetyltransferase [Nocardioides sp. Soil805]
MHTLVIRPARPADARRLVVVEVEAGQVFRTVGMARVAEDVPRVSDLLEAIAAQRIWVTEVGAEVAGYICAEVLDGNAHIAQVSVAPAHAGRALGRSMIEHVEQWGRAAGLRATTLTTFRDVPWNGPYYRRLGYHVLSDDLVGPELARTMAHEASLPGIDAALRCAMVKPH